jgi:hypothetical protein
MMRNASRLRAIVVDVAVLCSDLIVSSAEESGRPALFAVQKRFPV